MMILQYKLLLKIVQKRGEKKRAVQGVVDK